MGKDGPARSSPSRRLGSCKLQPGLLALARIRATTPILLSTWLSRARIAVAANPHESAGLSLQVATAFHFSPHLLCSSSCSTSQPKSSGSSRLLGPDSTIRRSSLSCAPQSSPTQTHHTTELLSTAARSLLDPRCAPRLLHERQQTLCITAACFLSPMFLSYRASTPTFAQ